MSAFGTLPVTVRRDHGKGAARTLRRAGRIPAVMYGFGQDNVLLDLDPNDLRKATDPDREWNTIFELQVDDGGQTKTEVCMVADVQRDSIRRIVTHLDFMRVDPEREIIREVPVQFVGRAAGVQKGGKLNALRRHVRVASLPANLPVAVRVDVTEVDSGESLRVKDVQLDNARLVENPEQRLCIVEMPKVKKEDEEEEAAAGAKKPAAKPAAG